MSFSPLVGSWGDQPEDERQLQLMEAHARAQVIRKQQEQIRLQQQSGLQSPPPPNNSQSTFGSPTQPLRQQTQQTLQQPSKQPSPPPTTAVTTAPSSAVSTGVDSHGEAYHASYIDPNKPMSPAFLAQMAALQQAHQANSAANPNGPAGGWGASGKLKEMARSVFERAYGLNGRPSEDHETLCEEVMLETACSRKSFCELVYGHSYAAELTDLRALIPNYRPKEKRKRDASERGRGKKRTESMEEDQPNMNQHGHNQPRQQQHQSHGSHHPNQHHDPNASRSLYNANANGGHSTHIRALPGFGVNQTNQHQSHHQHHAIHQQPPISIGLTPQQQQQVTLANLNTFLNRSQQQQQQQFIQPHPQQPVYHNGATHQQPQQQLFYQNLSQNPTQPQPSLTHRLIPSNHQNAQPLAALHTYQIHHGMPANPVTIIQPAQPLQSSSHQPTPHRFSPPPPTHPPTNGHTNHSNGHGHAHTTGSGSRHNSPAPSPLLKPIPSVHNSPLLTGLPTQRRSVDATNAILASVVAAHSVSPHLKSLGDPSSNPIIVPESPNLAPTTGSALKSAAKVVGSPLRQSMSAAALLAGSANLPPRASPSLNPMRQFAHPPGFTFPSPSLTAQASPLLMPMKVSQPVTPNVTPMTNNTPLVTNAPVASVPTVTSPSSADAIVATAATEATVETKPPAIEPIAPVKEAEAAAPATTPPQSTAPAVVTQPLSKKAAAKAAAAAAAKEKEKEIAPAVEPAPIEKEEPKVEVAKPAEESKSKKDRKKKSKEMAPVPEAVKEEEVTAEEPVVDTSTTTESSSSELNKSEATVADELEQSGSSSNAEKKKKKKERAKAKRAAEEAEAKKKAESEAAAATPAAEEEAIPAFAKSSPKAGSTKKSASLKKRKLSQPPSSPTSFTLKSPDHGSKATSSMAALAPPAVATSSSTSVIQVLLFMLIGSALFIVTRSYLATTLYDADAPSAGNGPVWSLIAALYLVSVFFYMWLFRQTHDQGWSALIIELSNQLEKYVITWELLAVDDPAQLLAAINQIQTLLDATLASFTGLSPAMDKSHAVAALEHAVQTMDFLHLAHRNLISELGSTQPIMRLVGSLGTVRTKLMQIRSKVTAGTVIDAHHKTVSASSITPFTLLLLSLFLINALILLFGPPCNSILLNFCLPLILLSLLSILVLVVWSSQYPFNSIPSAPTVFPSNLLQLVGVNLSVSLEPLHYLRTRLTEKETEANERIEHPELHPIAHHAPIDEEEEETE